MRTARLVSSLLLFLATTLAPHLPAAPFAYVSNALDDTVTVVDTATNARVGAIAVGRNPLGVAVSPGGDRVFVVNGNSNSVSVIDVASGTVRATITVGTTPYGVAVDPAGAYAYVTNRNSNNVSVIDVAALAVVATIPVGATPYGVAATATRVYVGNYLGSSVSVIDLPSRAVVATLPVGARPFGLALDGAGARLYVGSWSEARVQVIDTATLSVVASIPVGASPFGIAVRPDGSAAYVANYGSNSVSVIAAASNAVIATVPVGSSPRGISLTPDGARLYVTSSLENNLSVIDTATHIVVARVPTGGSPVAFGQFIQPGAWVPPPPPPKVPGAPEGVGAVAGDTLATLHFSAPASDGGSPILAYTATCSPGGVGATASGSPIVVTGLANGVTYSCSVAASNAVGTGAASAAVEVTPFAPPAPVAETPSIALGTTALHFGGQASGRKPATLAVRIDNLGPGTLRVSALALTGPFTATHDCASVPAGARCEVLVTFAPEARAASGNAPRTVTGTLAIVGNAQGGPHEVRLFGSGEK
ncbi:MAG TPA: beta-propeller fold lactonase family protein [Gemmatimonadaceae bacterium]|nr:beta-propeller fold lactonase family protein [Gemmatimonadaceae bacterium]